MNNIIKKFTCWLHKKGIHSYSIPVKRYTEDVYYIEGEGDTGSQKKFNTFMRFKCKYCNKRKNKLEGTTVRMWE